MLNKVVVRYLDRTINRGYTTDFNPNKEVFHLMVKNTDGEKPVIVLTNTLKAVFFVKDLNGNGHSVLKKSFDDMKNIKVYGKKVKVEFFDGEILYGIANGYSVQRQGFFFNPIDKASNNERIFAVLNALKDITFL